MLLKDISNEFREVDKLLKMLNAYSNKVVSLYNLNSSAFTMEKMVELIPETRKLIKQQSILESKKFKSSSVNNYIKEYLYYIEKFIITFDSCMKEMSVNTEAEVNRNIIRLMQEHSIRMSEILKRFCYAHEIIEMVYEETWEPIPSAINEYNDVTILSETQSTSLSSISKDIGALDNFLNNISLLIKENDKNNFYLRKVESGSLAVVISCVVGASQIISFIFLYIKLYQQAEKRELKNNERKLELINKSLDAAKTILELDPQNIEANEIIQKCGLHILEFLENNPKGTINNQSYDIGIENLKIEEKKED